MTQILLTAKEIAELIGVTKRAVLLRAQKESWTLIEECGNGGKTKKYILSGLPMEMQASYYNKELQGTCQGAKVNPPVSPFEKGGERLESRPRSGRGKALRGNDREVEGEGMDNLPQPKIQPPPIPASGGQPSGTVPLPTHFPDRTGSRIADPGLAQWQTDIGLARWGLVSAFLKAKNGSRKSAGLTVAEAGKQFVDAYNTGISHPDIYQIIGKTAIKTLEKWARTLKNNNNDFVSIAPQHGRHRRGKRIVTEMEMSAMLKYALAPSRLRISQVIQWAKKDMDQRGLASPSSPATLRRAMIDWKNRNYDKWVFCREGEKALEDKVLPYIERDDTALAVGDILVADGHTLNFQVIHPYTGKPCRPTLLLFYDWASRYPAGWYIMATENVQCIHAALRRAILNLGKFPKMVLLDNGKAFAAKIFTDPACVFDERAIGGLYARLGIETHFALPYNAKAKPVERFFGTFNELERLLPSYTGNSIADKPAWMLRNEKLHKKLHNPTIPTIAQTDEVIRAWAYGEYALRKHRGLRGKCPADVWEAGKGTGVNEEALRFLMMYQEQKKIQRNGVTLFGQHYYSEALYGYKEPVMVRHDILDMSRVYIYTADGFDFICEAEPVRAIHPMIKLTEDRMDLEALKEHNRSKGRMKRSTEKEARARAAEMAPWNFPEEEQAKYKELPLSPERAAEIERQVAQMECIPLTEDTPFYYESPWHKYETFFTKRTRGEALTDEDRAFMAEFEESADYRSNLYYFNALADRLRVEAEIAGGMNDQTR